MLRRFRPQALPGHVDHYFFAALPDPETAAQIAAFAAGFRRQMGLHGTLLPAERLHITLCNISYLTPSILAELREAAEHTDMQPFDVMFDHVTSFTRRSAGRPLVLCEKDGDHDGTAGLHQLHDAICKMLVKARLHHIQLRKTFSPHVTLLYGPQDVQKQEVTQFSWRVEKLTLIHSLQGLGIYRILGEWPLRGSIPAAPRSAMQAPYLSRPVPACNLTEDARYDDG